MNKTKQREIILRTIETSTSHPTADDVFQLVRQQLPNISLGTVYRNLGLLTDIGKIRKITVPGEADRFDQNETWHDHLICAQCGKVMDITLDITPPIMQQLAEKSGMEILGYSLVAHCICPACNADSAE